MMKKLLFILPLVAVVLSCGDRVKSQKDQGSELTPIALKTEKDKISYALGSLDAKKILESNPNGSRLNQEELFEGYKNGFKDGISADPNSEDMQNINKLFGIQGMDFDTTYLKEGSRSYGILTASMLYQGLARVSEIESIDADVLFRGFQDGLGKVDSVMTEDEKMAVVETFGKRVQEKMMAEQTAKSTQIELEEAADWLKIKAINGIQELDQGVYLETLKKGSGEFPTATSDVEASYILSNLKGEVQQRSSDFGQNFKTNLQGVVQGWTIGFQSMQKGGKYKLYIPGKMGYGEETLVFEIEVFDIGPAGSIAPPRQ